MQFKDIVVALSVIFLWAANLIIQKSLCIEISLEFFNLMRFLCCIPLLLIFRTPPFALFKLFLVAIFWHVLNFFLIALSLQSGTGAGFFSVVYQVCAFFGILCCFLLIKESPKIHQLIGMILSFSGVVLLFNESLSNTTYEGLWYVLLAAMSWGMGVALIKKYKLSSDLSTNVWLASISFFPMAGITYFRGGDAFIQSSLEALSLKIMMGILFSAYGALLLGGCIWFYLLKKYSSALITPFMLLFPAVSCVLSYLLLGERFTLLQITAFLIIVFGILINQNMFNLSLFSHRPNNLWKKWTSVN